MSQYQTIIEASGNSSGYWKDLWNYRGLFRFLAWRDLLVRYKQTVIGVAWAVIRPLLTIVVFSFWGAANATETYGFPRPLIVAAATVCWTLFSSILSESSNSLVANSNLVSKVYFPRLIVPFSTILVCLVDALFACAIVIGLMIWFGLVPSITFFFLPLFILLAIVSAMGTGLLLAALNVKYRDFRYVIPFFIQLGIFISPIASTTAEILSNDRIPEFAKIIYPLNPIVGVIEGFRWSLLSDTYPINWSSVWLSIGFSLIMLIIGIGYFRKVERHFADVI